MDHVGILTRARCAIGLHPWETTEGYPRLSRPHLPQAPRPLAWVVQARCTNPRCSEHYWRVIDETAPGGSRA